MRQSDIRRMLNHVWGNFRCPRCDTGLHKGKMEINANTNLGLMCTIECPSCSALVRVNGFLQGTEKNRELSVKPIDTQNIQVAVEKIKKFDGNNISELFQ